MRQFKDPLETPLKPTQQPRRIPQALLLAAAVASGVSAVLFGFLYFSLYWPYRGLFNEEGRYVDAHGLAVHHEQASLLMIPALALLACASFLAVAWWVRRHRGGDTAGGP